MPFSVDWPHVFVDGPGHTASGEEVMDNLNALVAAIVSFYGESGSGGGGGSGGVPTGTIIMWSEPAAPAGWLYGAGGSHPTADFPDLFALIGYRFGGSGSSFNVPNFADRFPIGSWPSIPAGATGGENAHTLSIAELPKHRHTMPRTVEMNPGGPVLGYTVISNSNIPYDNTLQTDYSLTDSSGNDIGSGQAHENRPKYLGIGFVIKT